MFELFKTFFLIGAFTFGGGSAMISIMEKEIVQKRKWMTIDEFLDLIALAQASPGAIAVNSSIIIGYKLKGLAGAIVSATAAVLPSFMIMIGIAAFFRQVREYKFIEDMFIGIRPVIVALMASSVLSLATQSSFRARHYLVLITVALLIAFLDVSPILILIVGGFGYLLARVIGDKRS